MAWRKNKFNAKRTQDTEGRWYDSKTEHDYCMEVLIPLRDSGMITDLQWQPQTYLTKASIGYKPDFSYIEAERLVYVDVKGFMTDIFNIKMRLWRWYGPAVLRIVVRSGKGWRTTKEIMPKIGGSDEG